MNEKRKRIRRLRLLSMTAVVGAITIGMIVGLGTGTLSAGGLKELYAICPLGYLTSALAGRDLMPRLFICFLVIAGLTILLGRIFCGWFCPVPLERKLLTNKIDEPNKLFHRIKGKEHHDKHPDSNEVNDHNQSIQMAEIKEKRHLQSPFLSQSNPPMACPFSLEHWLLRLFLSSLYFA